MTWPAQRRIQASASGKRISWFSKDSDEVIRADDFRRRERACSTERVPCRERLAQNLAGTMKRPDADWKPWKVLMVSARDTGTSPSTVRYKLCHSTTYKVHMCTYRTTYVYRHYTTHYPSGTLVQWRLRPPLPRWRVSPREKPAGGASHLDSQGCAMVNSICMLRRQTHSAIGYMHVKTANPIFHACDNILLSSHLLVSWQYKTCSRCRAHHPSWLLRSLGWSASG